LMILVFRQNYLHHAACREDPRKQLKPARLYKKKKKSSRLFLVVAVLSVVNRKTQFYLAAQCSRR
jgi:hypothetical protein